MSDIEQIDPLACEEALDSFDSAFSHMRTRSFKCHCGVLYWDCHNSGYDWQEGEVEELEADPKAVACEYSIDVIWLEGREYANACSCWHPRASRIIEWLENNRSSVAKFLKLEKDRIVAEARQMETVD